MMDLEMQPARRFIGRAYAEASASENGSYQEVWQDWMDQDRFKALDELSGKQQRTVLVVFSPYDSMVYWIGNLFPAGTPAPKGYQQFDLPAATAAHMSKPTSMMMTGYPVTMAIQQGATAIDMAGFPLPEYIGQTNTPYYIEDYTLDNDTVKSVDYTIYEGADRDFGYDDVE